MTKEVIIDLLTEKHNAFVMYISKLPNDEYLYSNKGKWTAEQQLRHIILCIKPLVQVFSLDKKMIEQTFGKISRESQDYETLLYHYIKKLKEGGKAPERYLPLIDPNDSKDILTEKLLNLIKELCLKIKIYNEQELDSFLIPHPLLGNLTFREMLYNTIYHVEHHQNLTTYNLQDL